MKKILVVFIAFVIAGFVFAQTPVVVKPVATDKVTVAFFTDDGTETGKKMDAKDFVFYLLRVIGDKPNGGQVSIFGEKNISLIPTQKDGLYVLGGFSPEYGWLAEGNFWIELTIKDQKYSSRGAEVFKDRNGNLQIFIRFVEYVPKAYKP